MHGTPDEFRNGVGDGTKHTLSGRGIRTHLLFVRRPKGRGNEAYGVPLHRLQKNPRVLFVVGVCSRAGLEKGACGDCAGAEGRSAAISHARAHRCANHAGVITESV